MLKFFLTRLLSSIPVIILVTFGVFSLVLLIPGDVAVTIAGGETATNEQIAEIRANLGLDRPLLFRYFNWLGGVLQGDLGTSLFTSRTVATSITSALPVTLSLALAAILISLAISVPLAVLSAQFRGGFLDRTASIASSVGIALPSFWIGLLLVLFFSIELKWLPASGYVPFSESPAEWLSHILLPALTLGISGAAENTRQLRGSLIDVFKQDYIRTARSKGLTSRVVIGKHAFKNAAVPLVTVVGLQVTFLLGGAVVIERVFGIPGLGSVVINAVTLRDIPVIQGVVLVAVVVTMAANLIVDLLYGYLNPRVRVSNGR